MKVKNTSARMYWVGGVMCLPGQTTDKVPDSAEKDIEGMDDLTIVGGKAIEEEKPSMTKAELQAALDEKQVAYSATANKAELQALYDAA